MAVIQFKYSLIKESSFKFRLGELLSKNEKINTPNCILYTKNGGLVPHLIKKLEDNLLTRAKEPNLGVLIHLEDYFDKKYYKETLKSGLGKAINSKSPLLLVDLNDTKLIKNADEDLNTNNTGVSLSAHQGKLRVKADEYNDIINNWKPDIVIPLHDLLYSTTKIPSEKRANKSVRRNINWLNELLESDLKASNLLGVLGGSIYYTERKRASEMLKEHQKHIKGYLISSLHGTPSQKGEQISQSLESLTAEYRDKPNFCFEMNTPEELLEGIVRGVDVFDSSYATQVANYGNALNLEFQPHETFLQPIVSLNPGETQFSEDVETINKKCQCYTCKSKFSKAYIVHLLNTSEMLSTVLLTCHNLHNYIRFLSQIRESIKNGNFESDLKKFKDHYKDFNWHVYKKSPFMAAKQGTFN
jgi:tRNA-guanine family transglycosylase